MATRGELLADIASWADRPDLATNPSILRVAQAMIDRDVRLASQERSVGVLAPEPTAGAGVSYTDLARSNTYPSDVVEVHSLAILSGTESNNFQQPETQPTVRYVTPLVFNDILPDGPSRLVRVYTIVGTSVRIFPPLGEGDPVHLVYQARLPRLTASGSTNDLLTGAYDVYLYAGLVTAGVFLQDQTLESTYAQRYADAIATLRRTEARKHFPVVVHDTQRARTGVQP